jgi:hypothetical protein
VRVTDVLLTATAGALSRALDPVPPTVRVEVPLTMRVPGTHPGGNATGAVMIELPLDRMPESDRLAEIGRRGQRLYTGTRALGSRLVIGVVCEMPPAPVLSRFARTVYGHRFFQAIMSNMPGPVGMYRLAGAPITEVYPIVPLAPRIPLAVGSLSWGATMYVGVSIDPVLADLEPFTAAFQTTLAELLSPGVLLPHSVDE